MAETGQRRGRPLDYGVGHAILAATRELLQEVGYATLTVEAVARRAGVGKAAIYRRYSTKQEMVFSAAVHDLTLSAPPDTGSLEADLAALCGDIVASLTGPAIFAALPGLFAEVATDEALATQFQRTFIARERECIVEVLRRARGRGELADPPAVEVVHSLLLGPVFVWLFMFRGDAEGIAAAVGRLAFTALTGRTPT